MPRRLPTPPASTMAMLRVMCVKMKGVFLVGDDRWRRLMEFGGVVAGRSGWGRGTECTVFLFFPLDCSKGKHFF